MQPALATRDLLGGAHQQARQRMTSDLRALLVLALVVCGCYGVVRYLRRYAVHVDHATFRKRFETLPKIETGVRKRF